MKVYLFYLKPDNELYCYTANKDYRDKFIYQRNKKKFIIKKVNMTDIEFSIFSNKYSTQMLIETPLSTSLTDYVDVIASYDEENELIDAGDKMDNDMDRLYRDLVTRSNLKDKYKKSLDYLITTGYFSQEKNQTKDLISNANQIHLFTKLFKDTFDDTGNTDD